MKILAIGAHPDDIEYGCGGTLLRATDTGHELHLLVLTDGASGGDPATRKTEQEKSAAVLGAALHWGGFEDTWLSYGRDLIKAVETRVMQIQPDVVLVNSPDDSHQDHQATARATVAACRYVKSILFYHDYTSLNFQGGIYTDLAGGLLDRKTALLDCHYSQTSRPNPAELDMLESVRALAAYYGFLAKVKYAEAFYPCRYLLPFPLKSL